MSALFNMDALVRFLVLSVCTVTYLKRQFPSLITKNKEGLYSVFHKFAVVGTRLSPFVAMFCLVLGLGKFISVFI